MSTTEDFRIGVVLEAFVDLSLEPTLQFLATQAPDVSVVEVGAGGYAPNPHCDVDGLLASEQARRDWLALLDRYGIGLDSLNAWGNPVHPDAELAEQHDRALRQAIRLATELGADRVIAMAGCPAGSAGDQTAHFGAGGWLPYLEGIHDRQWTDVVAPYWADLAAFARAQNPDLLVCIELHPGTAVYNVATFEAFIELGPSLSANFDPSHFFWMGMDGHAVAERICDRVGHVHGKDTTFNEQNLALNGVLDHRWPTSPESMPWNFSVPGRGHDVTWWAGLMGRLAGSPATVVSIEHEDPFVPASVGVPEASRLLREAIDLAKKEAKNT
ncbi:MAG: sugar phosphate isomerase/epimerase [Ilumatobacteraceae bacterium]